MDRGPNPQHALCGKLQAFALTVVFGKGLRLLIFFLNRLSVQKPSTPLLWKAEMESIEKLIPDCMVRLSPANAAIR